MLAWPANPREKPSKWVRFSNYRDVHLAPVDPLGRGFSIV